MTPRKTMVVPCIVKSELNVSALTSVLSGFISWRRMISASMPPIRKKMNAVLPYRMPIRLWSTVVIQLQIPVFAGAWAAGAWSRTEVAMAASVLLVRAEVRHQRGDLLVGELPGEHHQGPLLDRIGIAEPLPDVLVGVFQQARHDGAAAPDVAQIGPLHLDDPRGRRARHRVAPDAAARAAESAGRVVSGVTRPLSTSGEPTRWCSIQAANCSGVSEITRNPIRACCSPQNSAHWPLKVPVTSALNQSGLCLPGKTSRLPANWGTQKLWITSTVVIRRFTVFPTGTCISSAVTTPSLE